MATFVINIEQASGCHSDPLFLPRLYFYATTHTFIRAQYLADRRVGVWWAWRRV